jgi:hypothetical protein
MYRAPVGFSVTSIRRSGRKAIAHGLSNPDATLVTESGVSVFTGGACVCPGNAGFGSHPAAAVPAFEQAAPASASAASVVVRMRRCPPWRAVRSAPVL